MVNTGIVVEVGDTLRFDCQGWINQGWTARFPPGDIIVDGAGRRPDGSLNNSARSDGGYPLEGSIRYALIGQIVSSTGVPFRPFYIGKVSRPLRVDVRGTLWIGANDNDLTDNGPTSGPETPWRVNIGHTVPDLPAPLGTPGLKITDIQILQVARPKDPNDTVLVGGKTTAVRAFIDLRDSPGPTTRVDGFVEVNGKRFSALNPRPMGPHAVQPQVGEAAPDPDQTTASLNFEVPGSFLPADGNFTHHTFSVTAFIGEGNPQPGFFYTDERRVGFSRGVPMEIHFLYIIGKDGDNPAASIGNLSVPNMEAQLPVPDGGLVARGCSPTVFTVPHIHADNLNDMVLFINAARAGGTIQPGVLSGKDKIVFGVVVPSSGYAGVNSFSTVIVQLKKGNDAPEGTTGANATGVHELGHAYGLGHVSGCESPSGVDPTLPQALALPGWTTVLHQVVRSGTKANMSYCARSWPTAIELSQVILDAKHFSRGTTALTITVSDGFHESDDTSEPFTLAQD